MNLVINKECKLATNVVNLRMSFLLFVCFTGCSKLVNIPPPSDSITTEQVFHDSSQVAAAISGLYSKIEYGVSAPSFCNGAETIYCGILSDELVPSIVSGDQFYLNQLSSTNGNVSSLFWVPAYSYIYKANSCIENLEGNNSVPGSVSRHYLAEAKFLRALMYFNLVNLFGDVPYVESTSWATTLATPRSSIDEVYLHIVSDLQDAQANLPEDYLLSNGLRTRANKWAATALLSRVYLYRNDWSKAADEATTLIENNLFSLNAELAEVFSLNSSEAILQWELNTNYRPFIATQVGFSILPGFLNVPPKFYCSPQLLNSFEPNDLRHSIWLDSIDANGVTYFAPYKYKIGPREATAGAAGSPATELYTVLRLAEQYLIRAEARLNLGDVAGAISDLNIIRNRAELPNLPDSLTEQQLKDAIEQERRIELFAEWGHRWFDLRRTGKIEEVMSVVTPQKVGGGQWNSNQQLLPIPQAEINLNSKLVQNPGY